MSYLIAFAISAFFWLLANAVLGSYIEENITLSSMSIASFRQVYSIVVTIAAVLTAFLTCYWFFYGAKDKAASEQEKAQKIWKSIFIFLMAVSVIKLAIIFQIFSNEGVSIEYYGLIYLMLSTQTYFSFWITSLLFSPTNVKYIPFLADKIR